MTKPQRRLTEQRVQTSEQKQKAHVRLALEAYHVQFVVPLESRLSAVEAKLVPWWKRWTRITSRPEGQAEP